MTSQILSGLKDVADLYEAFVIDLWGVIHDGIKPYPAALDALKKLKDLRKTTLLLSNSPRRCEKAIDHLASMGISRDLYTHIYTSGEDTYQALKNRPSAFHQNLGERLYHLGPAMHHPLYTGLPYEKMETPDTADFILATGADFPRLQDYEPTLYPALHHRLPMVCANPDRVIVQGGQMTLCCGAIAEWYEQLGGQVHYHGKPYSPVYQTVFSLLEGISASRILAIGDSLTTDIQGAQNAGMDNVLIMGGIHHESLLLMGSVTNETPQNIEKLSVKVGIKPTYALQDLKWE